MRPHLRLKSERTVDRDAGFAGGDGASAAIYPAQVRPSLRGLWFKSYPFSQTVIAFFIALLATTALSIDPSRPVYGKIWEADPGAKGALYILYEVIYSFAGHIDALMLLALAILLVFPFRAIYFGRRDAWRPSLVVPAMLFALTMVFGKSFDEQNNSLLVMGGISQIIESFIAGTGWFLLGHVGFYLVFEFFDWLGGMPAGFSESRYGRLFRVFDVVLNRRPFLIPAALLALAWLPQLIGAWPGLFMGDTGGQIRQWFGYHYTYPPQAYLDNTSDYLNFVSPEVMLNGHHPVLHTAMMGSCVQLGMALFGSENAGIALYTVLQFGVTVALCAYLVSTLRRFGVGLPVRALSLAFMMFMPLFGNYAVLLTKDTLFADALMLVVIQGAKYLMLSLPRERRGRDGEIHHSLAVVAPPLAVGARDAALLALGCLGSTFLRNGGVVFPFVLLAVLLVFCRDTRKMLAVVLVGTLAVWYMVGNMLFPALQITPGSRREILSIPFQQTARFVVEHDSANAGVEEGVSDGLVTPEERAIIDRVLDYSDLAVRYVPTKSDAVKGKFNEDATTEDLKAYFKVWADQFFRDPTCYINAVANNYYGYFYPSEQDVFVYGPSYSRQVMGRADTALFFDFYQPLNPVVDACASATTLYRVLVQRMPPFSLLMSTPLYSWMAILLAIYLGRDRQWRACALVVPMLLVLAMCLIGPCNGTTYMRYVYPIILMAPFVLPLAVAWPRRLQEAR